jgi:hypothetical protein
MFTGSLRKTSETYFATRYRQSAIDIKRVVAM